MTFLLQIDKHLAISAAFCYSTLLSEWKRPSCFLISSPSSAFPPPGQTSSGCGRRRTYPSGTSSSSSALRSPRPIYKRQRGQSLPSLKGQVDISTSTGKLLFTLMSAIAQFGRDMIADGTREGLRSVRARRRNRGRPRASANPGDIPRGLHSYNMYFIFLGFRGCYCLSFNIQGNRCCYL
ncbi:MAG: recombinase family protein [Clostridiales bacterium]|nr:recombinase family protein [Clostridiales bacterium]